MSFPRLFDNAKYNNKDSNEDVICLFPDYSSY